MTITWRETPIASSNHDLSYARSQDLISWESSDGSPIKLPIVLATGEIIDPIPEHGGLLNGRADGWVIKQVSDWDDVYADLDRSGALDLPLVTNDPAYVNAAVSSNLPYQTRSRNMIWIMTFLNVLFP